MVGIPGMGSPPEKLEKRRSAPCRREAAQDAPPENPDCPPAIPRRARAANRRGAETRPSAWDAAGRRLLPRPFQLVKDKGQHLLRL